MTFEWILKCLKGQYVIQRFVNIITGMISLKNWKPLMLDQVCDSPHKTVGDILNDLTNHATLRFLVTR